MCVTVCFYKVESFEKKMGFFLTTRGFRMQKYVQVTNKKCYSA